jgi:hypothetical protein
LSRKKKTAELKKRELLIACTLAAPSQQQLAGNII